MVTICRFDLNDNRTALSLNGILADKVANTNEEVKRKMFARGFISGIIDIQVGAMVTCMSLLTVREQYIEYCPSKRVSPVM